LNYGTEIGYQDVNADLEGIVPLHVHVHKRNKEKEKGSQEYVDEKLGKKRKR
jgi:hypothetical protein